MEPFKIFRALIIGTLVLALMVVLVAFVLPATAHVERSINVERSQKTVFTVLNGYQHFSSWSPWADLDPDMNVSIAGPLQGVGASYTWSSEQASAGSGYQEIIESVPNTTVRSRLEFSGMESKNFASFNLEALSEMQTKVTWAHDADFGDSLFGRYFGLFLDRLVGSDYERGLQQLKSHLETLPAADFSDLEVSVLQVEAMPIAYVSGKSVTSPDAIAEAYEEALAKVRSALSRDGLQSVGPPLVIGRKWDEVAKVYEFDAAYPVSTRVSKLRADKTVFLGKTYAGSVLKAEHKGPYSDLADHFQRLMAYKKAMGYIDNGSPWDVYASDPERTPQAELMTVTFVPVRLAP